MSFDLERFDKYQTKAFDKYEEIMKSNGYVLLKKFEVGKEQWNSSCDWMWGDVIWMKPKDFGCDIEFSDLKTCGLYGGAVKLTQLTNDNCKVNFFDFFDVLNNTHVYRISRENLIKLYKQGNWRQDVNEKVNDKKKSLIRFDTELLKTNSIILS